MAGPRGQRIAYLLVTLLALAAVVVLTYKGYSGAWSGTNDG